MNDSGYIKVGVSSETIIVMLVGFWYKEKKVLERLESICQTIPLTVVAADWHDEVLGSILMEHGDLEAEFTDFILNNPLGEFCHNVVGSQRFELYGRTRIALDLGRHIKTTGWWTDNMKEMKSIKAKLKTIRDIQED